MSGKIFSALADLLRYIARVTEAPAAPKYTRAERTQHVNTVKIRPRTEENAAASRLRERNSFTVPAEKDFSLRSFQVLNPEGEIHAVDTSDRSSPFYGPVWTRILDAYAKGEFLRGRVFMRCVSRGDRFSGYMASVDGVRVFLPQSKAHIFYDPEKDATNKCLALKIDAVYTNGAKQGTVIADARAPWKYILNEFNDMEPGKVCHALASDYEHRELVFPVRHGQKITVPIDEAVKFAERAGAPRNPDLLTGLYWKLKLRAPVNGGWIAEPAGIFL